MWLLFVWFYLIYLSFIYAGKPHVVELFIPNEPWPRKQHTFIYTTQCRLKQHESVQWSSKNSAQKGWLATLSEQQLAFTAWDWTGMNCSFRDGFVKPQSLPVVLFSSLWSPIRTLVSNPHINMTRMGVFHLCCAPIDLWGASCCVLRLGRKRSSERGHSDVIQGIRSLWISCYCYLLYVEINPVTLKTHFR